MINGKRPAGLLRLLLLFLLSPAHLGLAAPAPAAKAGDPYPLLQPLAGYDLGAAASKDGAVPGEPAIARRRPVRVDASRLWAGVGVEPKEALRVELSLFDDAVYTATLTGEASRTLPYVTWRGPLDGDPDSQVVLVAREGRIAASIQTLDRMYQIVGTADPGVHEVEEIDPKGLPREIDPILSPPEAEGAEEAAIGPEAGELPWLKDDPTSFDVLVAYTSTAREQSGDPLNVQNLITLGIEQLNTTFERSGIDLRARLVQMVELSYTEDDNIAVDLARLQRKGDGYLDGIHALRDSLKADVVALVRSRVFGTFCGLAYIMNGANNHAFEANAFSVTGLNCVTIGYTLAHEIGHNLGCNHAREDPTGTGAFSYSYAFKDIGGPFRTLMAYNCLEGCPPILNFSSPNVSVDGRVTGTERENNALSIQNVRGIVANFRTSAAGGGSCNAKLGPFAACQGDACSVCALKISAYPHYLQRHPGCNLNTACAGRKYQRCSRSCPAPTNADR